MKKDKVKTIKYLENLKKRAEKVADYWNGKTRQEILKEVAFAKKYRDYILPIIPSLDALTGGKHYCIYKDCENVPRIFLDGRFVYCDKHLPIMYKQYKSLK